LNFRNPYYILLAKASQRPRRRFQNSKIKTASEF
jgi:hypothetical protein